VRDVCSRGTGIGGGGAGRAGAGPGAGGGGGGAAAAGGGDGRVAGAEPVLAAGRGAGNAPDGSRRTGCGAADAAAGNDPDGSRFTGCGAAAAGADGGESRRGSGGGFVGGVVRGTDGIALLTDLGVGGGRRFFSASLGSATNPPATTVPSVAARAVARRR
jgi:hypothetical protein